MENLVEILTDDEDFMQLVNVVRRQRLPKVYRQRENHFAKWNDVDFVKRFRLSKVAVRFLINKVEHLIRSPTERNHAVSPEEMILATLRFYATGSFLQVAGDFVGIDKSTTSRVIHKVSRAIASLHREYIKMPESEIEVNNISQEFYNICRFPRCIGAIDCTHVRILSPGGNEAETYRNRKSFFSFNVQAICDASGKFENIVCRWPGSCHDATIFNNSRIRAKFEIGEYRDKLLVGDSGYGIKTYLITPLLNPITRAEQLFNEAQIRTRNPIERTFGRWKRRFPILAFGIRLKMQKVEAIVVSTAVLHNLACILNEPLPPVDQEEEIVLNLVNNVPHIPNRPVGYENNIVRNQLINDYFMHLLH